MVLDVDRRRAVAVPAARPTAGIEGHRGEGGGLENAEQPARKLIQQLRLRQAGAPEGERVASWQVEWPERWRGRGGGGMHMHMAAQDTQLQQREYS